VVGVGTMAEREERCPWIYISYSWPSVGVLSDPVFGRNRAQAYALLTLCSRQRVNDAQRFPEALCDQDSRVWRERRRIGCCLGVQRGESVIKLRVNCVASELSEFCSKSTDGTKESRLSFIDAPVDVGCARTPESSNPPHDASLPLHGLWLAANPPAHRSAVMASNQSPELDLAKCFKGEQQLVYVYLLKRFYIHICSAL
jgi:hypothetical protein